MKDPSDSRISFIKLHWALTFSIAALLQCSCSWSLSSPKAERHESDDISATYQQIRLRMRSLVDPMSGRIESTADQIVAEYDDPGIRRAAIEFKADGVPALREALFQPAPMTAVFDTWTFLFQTQDFYRTGDGAKALGPASGKVVTELRKMEAEYAVTVAEFTESKDVREGRTFAKNWAASHPIRDSIAYRPSTLTRSVEVDLPDEFTASDAIADITLTVDDLNRRLEIYSDQVVRQARWEAQLLSMDLSEQLELDQAVPLATSAVSEVGNISESFNHLTESIELLVPIIDRVAKVTESAPQLVAAERTVAIEAAQNEITRAIKTIEKERGITLQHITEERLAALQTIQQTITEERKLLVEEADSISSKLIDHSFKRATQLVIGIFLAVTILLLVGLFLVRQMIAGLIEKQAAIKIPG